MQMILKDDIKDFHKSSFFKVQCRYSFQLCSWGCVRRHRSFPWGLSDVMKTDIKVGTIDNLIIRLLDTTDTMEELDTPLLLDRFNQLQQLLERINWTPKDIFKENTCWHTCQTVQDHFHRIGPLEDHKIWGKITLLLFSGPLCPSSWHKTSGGPQEHCQW